MTCQRFIQHVATLLLLMKITATGASVRSAYATWNAEPPRIDVHDGLVKSGIAWATFSNDINNTGFSHLEVFTGDRYPDSIQAYAAGVLEGYLTKQLITYHYRNSFKDYCVNETQYCERLYDFLQQNLDFMNIQVDKNRLTEPYWHQVGLVLNQLKGLDDGYNGVVNEHPPDTYRNVTSILFLNVDGDLEDLEAVLKRSNMRRVLGSGSCTALIKILPHNQDVYFAHDTWSTYSSMQLILKKYSLKYHLTLTSDSLIPGHTVAFSSNPGKLYSGDDFYLISSGLATMETTIGNSNDSLWKFVKPTLNLEFVRNVVANRLASSGQEWCLIFTKLNSGTYNNEWMVLDYKKFTPGSKLQDGLLWVLEQLPGHIRSADLTAVLRRQGYWPSYNAPYFTDIFNLSGLPESVKKYGDWFSYDKTPRALIFGRDQGKVKDMESMTNLMRQNDYQNDNLSVCKCVPLHNAENAIAARSDLNPANGSYPFPSLQHRSHGAIDMKLTNYSLFQRLQFVAVAGPTYDPLPPFQWNISGFNDPHEGQPNLWKFSPILANWSSN